MINNECIEGEEGSLLLVPGSDTTHLRISKSPFGDFFLYTLRIFFVLSNLGFIVELKINYALAFY